MSKRINHVDRIHFVFVTQLEHGEIKQVYEYDRRGGANHIKERRLAASKWEEIHKCMMDLINEGRLNYFCGLDNE